MDWKHLFKGRTRGKVLHTPTGDFNLARAADRDRMKGIVVRLQRQTDALTRRDIKDWRDAWQAAINVENPDRRRLYDIYRDVVIDLHLSGCIAQRKGYVTAKKFKLTDAKGREDEEAARFLEQQWFKTFCSLALDSVYWGHSLIEFGEPVFDGSRPAGYSGMTLIPRKHVVPEYGLVLPEAGGDFKTGIPYREEPYAGTLIEAGAPDDLGLLLKAATQTIPKKNSLAFWDSFAEIFGMPMRIARTSSRDPAETQKLDRMLRDSASSLYAITSMDTEIEFVENARADSFNVYDKRIERANSELSKLIIGQTMTLDDGSSLSQSETHLKVFENLVDADRDLLQDIINNQLLPKMAAQGFPTAGLRFEWDETINYTPEEQVAFETMIADRYEVDPKYFAEKYSMPVGERRQIPAMPPAGGEERKGKEEKEEKEKEEKEGEGEEGRKRPEKAEHARPFFD